MQKPGHPIGDYRLWVNAPNRGIDRGLCSHYTPGESPRMQKLRASETEALRGRQMTSRQNGSVSLTTGASNLPYDLAERANLYSALDPTELIPASAATRHP